MQYLVPFSQVPKPAFVQDPTNIRGLLLKVRANNGSAPGDIRRAIVALRGDLPYLRVRPYLELLDRQMRPWTMGTRLLGLFSAIALFVSAIGMFAAFAHAIAERRREMAIRLAIGALPSSVRSLVLREALSIAAGGVVAGLLLSILAGRGIASLLFATTPADPLVLGLASGAMLLVAAVATFLPAREAARADPSVLLRSE